ncbi:MAG: hypothetical protein MZV64_19835 [Ignavibacteriales bacterium]|nr:hypothetical protein [Ignavibacteriales bacterium]
MSAGDASSCRTAWKWRATRSRQRQRQNIQGMNLPGVSGQRIEAGDTLTVYRVRRAEGPPRRHGRRFRTTPPC